MLRRFPSSFILIVVGIGLIVIAFFSISFLPSQMENWLSPFFIRLGVISQSTAETYRRIYADRFLLQSIYVFLTGIVLLVVGLCRTTNR